MGIAAPRGARDKLAAMNANDLLQRARAARTQSTLYWLGWGGWTRADEHGADPPAQPGRPIDIARALDELRHKRPGVHAAYLAGLAQAGLQMNELPGIACDCSGYVCWALGLARDGAPWRGGWINTDSLHADALGPQQLFRPLARAWPGALLVYPKPVGRGPEGPPGHVGIVTEVDAAGRATRVLHCAPENFALSPPAGLPRNAIAETGPELFDADPRTRAVAWVGMASTPA